MDFNSNRSLMHGLIRCMHLNASRIRIRSSEMANFVVFALSSNRSYNDSQSLYIIRQHRYFFIIVTFMALQMPQKWSVVEIVGHKTVINNCAERQFDILAVAFNWRQTFLHIE